MKDDERVSDELTSAQIDEDLRFWAQIADKTVQPLDTPPVVAALHRRYEMRSRGFKSFAFTAVAFCLLGVAAVFVLCDWVMTAEPTAPSSLAENKTSIQKPELATSPTSGELGWDDGLENPLQRLSFAMESFSQDIAILLSPEAQLAREVAELDQKMSPYSL